MKSHFGVPPPRKSTLIKSPKKIARVDNGQQKLEEVRHTGEGGPAEVLFKVGLLQRQGVVETSSIQKKEICTAVHSNVLAITGAWSQGRYGYYR